MARRRFYASPEEIDGATVWLSADETHHLIRVLRLTPGDEAFVFDGCGVEYKCSFASVKNGRAVLEIVDVMSDDVESPLKLTLAQALAKGEKLDFIIQKATELGVSRIAPLITRYADVKLDEQQSAKRVERWQRISLEALKQCGRRNLVEIDVPSTLRDFLSAPGAASATHRVLLLFNKPGGLGITHVLADASMLSEVVALVGPEGGWSDDELDLMRGHGCKAVTLGPRILRTETAAIVAMTLIQHAIGDLSARGNR